MMICKIGVSFVKKANGKVGRNLVSAYSVRKAATGITFRKGRVNRYLYAQKVGDTYKSKKSVLKVIFRE